MIHHPRHAFIITTIALLCATTAFSQDTAKDVAARVNGAEITQSDVAFAAPLFGDPAPNISPKPAPLPWSMRWSTSSCLLRPRAKQG